MCFFLGYGKGFGHRIGIVVDALKIHFIGRNGKIDLTHFQKNLNL